MCRVAGHRGCFLRLQWLSLLTPSRLSVCPQSPLLPLLTPYALSLSKFAFTRSEPPCSRLCLASNFCTIVPLWDKIRLLDNATPWKHLLVMSPRQKQAGSPWSLRRSLRPLSRLFIRRQSFLRFLVLELIPYHLVGALPMRAYLRNQYSMT